MKTDKMTLKFTWKNQLARILIKKKKAQKKEKWQGGEGGFKSYKMLKYHYKTLKLKMRSF